MAKVVYNDLIPFQGYKALTFIPFIFARKKFKPLDDVTLNHESIHLSQQFEVLIVAIALVLMLVFSLDLSWWWMLTTLIVYYGWYGIEYVIRLFIYGNHKEAYRNISFEQEAYMFEKDFNYLRKERNPFAWVKYLTRKTYKRQ